MAWVAAVLQHGKLVLYMWQHSTVRVDLSVSPVGTFWQGRDIVYLLSVHEQFQELAVILKTIDHIPAQALLSLSHPSMLHFAVMHHQWTVAKKILRDCENVDVNEFEASNGDVDPSSFHLMCSHARQSLVELVAEKYMYVHINHSSVRGNQRSGNCLFYLYKFGFFKAIDKLKATNVFPSYWNFEDSPNFGIDIGKTCLWYMAQHNRWKELASIVKNQPILYPHTVPKDTTSLYSGYTIAYFAFIAGEFDFLKLFLQKYPSGEIVDKPVPRSPSLALILAKKRYWNELRALLELGHKLSEAAWGLVLNEVLSRKVWSIARLLLASREFYATDDFKDTFDDIVLCQNIPVRSELAELFFFRARSKYAPSKKFNDIQEFKFQQINTVCASVYLKVYGNLNPRSFLGALPRELVQCVVEYVVKSKFPSLRSLSSRHLAMRCFSNASVKKAVEISSDNWLYKMKSTWRKFLNLDSLDPLLNPFLE